MSRALVWTLGIGVAGVVATVVFMALSLPAPTAISCLVALGGLTAALYEWSHDYVERRSLERRAREAAARTPEETERLREQARREDEARRRR